MADRILKRYCLVNPLHATALFLYPLENIRIQYVRCFQGAQKVKVTSGLECVKPSYMWLNLLNPFLPSVFFRSLQKTFFRAIKREIGKKKVTLLEIRLTVEKWSFKCYYNLKPQGNNLGAISIEWYNKITRQRCNYDNLVYCRCLMWASSRYTTYTFFKFVTPFEKWNRSFRLTTLF